MGSEGVSGDELMRRVLVATCKVLKAVRETRDSIRESVSSFPFPFLSLPSANCSQARLKPIVDSDDEEEEEEDEEDEEVDEEGGEDSGQGIFV